MKQRELSSELRASLWREHLSARLRDAELRALESARRAARARKDALQRIARLQANSQKARLYSRIAADTAAAATCLLDPVNRT